MEKLFFPSRRPPPSVRMAHSVTLLLLPSHTEFSDRQPGCVITARVLRRQSESLATKQRPSASTVKSSGSARVHTLSFMEDFIVSLSHLATPPSVFRPGLMTVAGGGSDHWMWTAGSPWRHKSQICSCACCAWWRWPYLIILQIISRRHISSSEQRWRATRDLTCRRTQESGGGGVNGRSRHSLHKFSWTQINTAALQKCAIFFRCIR